MSIFYAVAVIQNNFVYVWPASDPDLARNELRWTRQAVIAQEYVNEKQMLTISNIDVILQRFITDGCTVVNHQYSPDTVYLIKFTKLFNL